MNGFLVYLLVFVAGGIIGAVAEYLILRNNPQIVKDLEKSLAKAKAEAAEYRKVYEDLVTKLKNKVEGK